MKSPVADRSQLSTFRRLLRDVRNAARLCANPLANRLSAADGQHLADAVERALSVSLYRLPPRLHAIVARYDLARQPISAICKELAISRRQFHRDHRSALLQLMSLMLVPSKVVDQSAEGSRSDRLDFHPATLGSISRSPAVGLWNVGAYEQAFDLYCQEWHSNNSAERQIESALDAADIAVECGRIADARSIMDQIRAVTGPSSLHVRPYMAALAELIEGHLENSHPKRQEWYRRALATIGHPTGPNADRASCIMLQLKALHSLSLSHDHQGEWIAAREASEQAMRTLKQSTFDSSPIGSFIKANHAMRDARQFGNVDLSLETLWQCLELALRNGWVPVVGDIAVQFINLNLMRQRYGRALAWRQWISFVQPARLMARTRNFLAVDSAHALTMLGRPDRALAHLGHVGDEGLAFVGAREYWRADALRAGGNIRAAFILASQALEQAAAAESKKGEARCMRLLATCHHVLGHERLARKTIQECLDLSQQYVSPYDLFLTVVAARHLDKGYAADEGRLATLLRGRSQPAAFDPPVTI